MPARAEAPSPDADAVLAILSRPDDVDLAELVELVARICDSNAAGITVQRGEDYHVPGHPWHRAAGLPLGRHVLPRHDEH